MDPYKNYLEKNSNLLSLGRKAWPWAKGLASKGLGKIKGIPGAMNKTPTMVSLAAGGAAGGIAGTATGLLDYFRESPDLGEGIEGFNKIKDTINERVSTGLISPEEGQAVLNKLRDSELFKNNHISARDLKVTDKVPKVIKKDLKKYLIAAGVVAGGLGTMMAITELEDKKKEEERQKKNDYMA